MSEKVKFTPSNGWWLRNDTTQFCPFGEDVHCGDWCPAFTINEGVEHPTIKLFCFPQIISFYVTEK